MRKPQGRQLAVTALGSAAVGAGIAGISLKRHLSPQARVAPVKKDEPPVLELVRSGAGDEVDGPAGVPVDFPLSKAVGEAALSVQDDGSWSVRVTVIPTSPDAAALALASSNEDPMRCDLSPAVALMHSAILRAAKARDHKILEELAYGVSDEFTYSFEEPVLRGHPAKYWRELESQGTDVLGALVEVLELPYAKLDHMYLWPADLDWFDSASDWQSRTKGEVKRGYRTGIATTGDWLFFVADD